MTNERIARTNFTPWRGGSWTNLRRDSIASPVRRRRRRALSASHSFLEPRLCPVEHTANFSRDLPLGEFAQPGADRSSRAKGKRPRGLRRFRTNGIEPHHAATRPPMLTDALRSDRHSSGGSGSARGESSWSRRSAPRARPLFGQTQDARGRSYCWARWAATTVPGVRSTLPRRSGGGTNAARATERDASVRSSRSRSVL